MKVKVEEEDSLAVWANVIFNGTFCFDCFCAKIDIRMSLLGDFFLLKACSSGGDRMKSSRFDAPFFLKSANSVSGLNDGTLEIEVHTR